MNRFLSALLGVLVALSLSTSVEASKGSGGSKSTGVKGYVKKDGTYVAPHVRSVPPARATKPLPPPPPPSSSTKSTNAPRDPQGRIYRSATAKHDFERQTGYPHGRPGYVVDHIRPLACGGADTPSNMQWQTVTAAKAKDKMERVGCR